MCKGVHLRPIAGGVWARSPEPCAALAKGRIACERGGAVRRVPRAEEHESMSLARGPSLLLALAFAGCATSVVDRSGPGAGAGAAAGDADTDDAGALGGEVEAGLDGALGTALDGGTQPLEAGNAPSDASAVPDAATDADVAARADGGDAASGTGGAPDASAGGDADACGADGDGDGLTDCDELGDGDDWTDPAIFNGAWVRMAPQCSALGACSENDTRAKVSACMGRAPREELAQRAGWDWNDSPDDLCSAGYGFAPAFSVCAATWQAQWTATVRLAGGQHCWEIAGSATEGCAALYFDGEVAPVQTGKGVHCYARDAGDYPLLWHYTMDNGSTSSLHLRYCHDASGPCTPSAALPARMLRVAK